LNQILFCKTGPVLGLDVQGQQQKHRRYTNDCENENIVNSDWPAQRGGHGIFTGAIPVFVATFSNLHMRLFHF